MLLVYVAITSLFSYFTSDKSHAHIPDRMTTQQNRIYAIVKDPKLNSTKEGKMTIALYRTTMCKMIGELCTDSPKDADQNYARSMVGSISNYMTLPYTQPPASFAYWVGDGLQNSGFVPKSYAYEGIGFASIKGYRSIWNIFRNLSYLVLVFVIVTIGFMIMFRMKINAQTVVSIENALPHIVMALIYITFSFAIAGFLIDMMYLSIGIIISIISQLNIGNLHSDAIHVRALINEYVAAGFGGIWPYDSVLVNGNTKATDKIIETITGPGGPAFRTGYAFFNVLPTIISIPFRTVIAFMVGNWITDNFFANKLTDFFGSFKDLSLLGNSIGFLPNLISFAGGLLILAFVTSWIPGAILGLLILITIIVLMFNIFWMLLKSYISITLLIIFSPIILLLEAIPGRNSFSNWLKSLVAELLTFPLIILFTLVGYAIVTINHTSQVFTLPFLYGFDSNDIGTIIGLGIILMVPNLVKLVKDSLGVKDLPLNAGLGTFFGGGAVLTSLATGNLGAYGTLLRGYAPTLKRSVEGKGPLGKIISTGVDLATQRGAFSANYKEGKETAEESSLGPNPAKQQTT